MSTSRRLLPCLAAISIALTATLTGAPAGVAAPRSDPTPPVEWEPTVALSPKYNVQAPLVVAAPGADRTLVAGWWESASGEIGHLFVRVKRPAHGWTKAVEVGTGEVQWSSETPWLAVDGRGGVTVVYGFLDKVWSRYRTPTGTWQPRVLVHSGPWFGGFAPEPAIWVNRAGAAVVLWEWCGIGEPDFGNCIKWAAYRTPAGTWLPATRLEREQFPEGAGVATIAGDGTVTRYAPVPKRHGITVRTYRPGSGWSHPVRVARRWSWTAVGNAAGDQLFVTIEHQELRVRTKSRGKPWTPAVVVGSGARMSATVDRAGRGTIAYRDTARGGALSVVTSNVRGAWSAAYPLTADDEPISLVAAATDPAGHTVVSWVAEAGDPAHPVVRAVVRVPGSAWSEPMVVAGAPVHSAVELLATVRSDGAPAVGWRGSQGDDSTRWHRLRVRVAVPAQRGVAGSGERGRS